MDNLTIDTIINILDYVSEAIVISDKTGKILRYNKAAIKKLHLPAENLNKTLVDFIPEDELWKLQKALQEDSSDYYEIILQSLSGDMFPALVSGQYIHIDNQDLRVSTILDMTELKEKEKELISKSQEQLQKLKSHVISKVSTVNQEKNKLKDELQKEVHHYQDEIQENTRLIGSMKKQLVKLKSENDQLQIQLKKIKQNNIDFDSLLNIEIAKANKLKLNLAFMMISIDNFDDLLHIFGSISKMDILISATMRSFKQIVRKSDMIQYTQNGIFYFIFTDFDKKDLDMMISRLSLTKNIEDYNVEFKYGIAYLFEKDNAQRIIHRASRDLYEN
jgi:PAS domain S-box-containing protein